MSSDVRAEHVLSILHSADRGLWGQVPDPLRALSFAFDDVTCLITFKAEVSKELIVEDDDWEDLSFATTEIDSDELLGRDTRVEMDIVVVPPDQPLDPLPDGIVFLRVGEQAPEFYTGAMPHPGSRAHLIPHAPISEHRLGIPVRQAQDGHQGEGAGLGAEEEVRRHRHIHR